MSSIKYKIWMLLPLMAMISCESILDKFPEDKITPETFFTTENELELYSNNFYVACISGTGVLIHVSCLNLILAICKMWLIAVLKM